MIQQRLRARRGILTMNLGDRTDDQRGVTRGDTAIDSHPQPGRHPIQYGFAGRQQMPRGQVGESVLGRPRNRCASSSCSAPGRWTITELAARMAAILDEVWVMLNDTNGGFNDSEANDVAVKPTGPLADAMVTIATPAGWRRSAARYCSALTIMPPTSCAARGRRRRGSAQQRPRCQPAAELLRQQCPVRRYRRSVRTARPGCRRRSSCHRTHTPNR